MHEHDINNQNYSKTHTLAFPGSSKSSGPKSILDDAGDDLVFLTPALDSTSVRYQNLNLNVHDDDRGIPNHFQGFQTNVFESKLCVTLM